jgi:hypothetical protein
MNIALFMHSSYNSKKRNAGLWIERPANRKTAIDRLSMRTVNVCPIIVHSYPSGYVCSYRCRQLQSKVQQQSLRFTLCYPHPHYKNEAVEYVIWLNEQLQSHFRNSPLHALAGQQKPYANKCSVEKPSNEEHILFLHYASNSMVFVSILFHNTKIKVSYPSQF